MTNKWDPISDYLDVDYLMCANRVDKTWNKVSKSVKSGIRTISSNDIVMPFNILAYDTIRNPMVNMHHSFGVIHG
jgi:hypothetical protein